jgi:hypothetical protein
MKDVSAMKTQLRLPRRRYSFCVRKRRTVGLIAGGILVAIAIGLTLAHDFEPVYGGHPLSDWVRDYSKGPQHAKEEATQALRALETNAISVMLRWVGYEPSTWRTRAAGIVARLPLPRSMRYGMHTDTDFERAWNAAFSFSALGPSKTNVGPALVRIANDTNRNNSAVRALAILRVDTEFHTPVDFRLQINNPKAEQAYRRMLIE